MKPDCRPKRTLKPKGAVKGNEWRRGLTLSVFSMKIAPERSNDQSPPDGLPRGSMNVGRVPVTVTVEMEMFDANCYSTTHKQVSAPRRGSSWRAPRSQQLTSEDDPRILMRLRRVGTSASIPCGVIVPLYLIECKRAHAKLIVSGSHALCLPAQQHARKV